MAQWAYLDDTNCKTRYNIKSLSWIWGNDLAEDSMSYDMNHKHSQNNTPPKKKKKNNKQLIKNHLNIHNSFSKLKFFICKWYGTMITLWYFLTFVNYIREA